MQVHTSAVLETVAAPFLPALLFFHIGRTGGTSLTRYFQMMAPRSYIQSDPDEALPLQNVANPDAAMFISGHYRIGSWLRRLPAEWQTMIVIRGPVRHLLSTYWHLRTHETVAYGSRAADLIAAAKRLDLQTLLDSREGAAFEANFDNPQTRFILDKPAGPLDASDLARAQALLEQVTHVGTTERLSKLAAQVASRLTWAATWRDHPLPRVMTNPHNVMDLDELPRALLQRIQRLSEFDAELHQIAQRRQWAQLSPALPLPPSPMASSVRTLQIADLIRVGDVTMHGVQPGIELVIDNDSIMLHPPDRSAGVAEVTVEDVRLDGHNEVAGRLLLAHAAAEPVRFKIELRLQEVMLVAASFVIAAAQPCDVRIRFPAASGDGHLTLRTEMAATDSNSFAWATFAGFEIRETMPEQA